MFLMPSVQATTTNSMLAIAVMLKTTTMIKSLTTLILLTSMTSGLLAQNEDGYWDKERAVTKEINLSAGNRTWRRINLPTGTTEIAYRITLLENDQSLTGTLSSALGAIPSGYTQGASAALSLMSKVSGDDKCRYYIFKDQNGADYYINNEGDYKYSCYYNSSEITKDANVLSAGGSNCINGNVEYLYFAFKSTNVIQDERIILEVVPWVDKKASRGWSLEIKKAITQSCVENYPSATKPEELCGCILDKLQENYKVQDLQNMTEIELNKIFNSYSNICSEETGENDNQLDILRQSAYEASQKNDLATSISNYLQIINSGKATVSDYNSLGWYYLLSKQYLKALKYLREGDKIDDTELLIKGNLAHAYLLSGDLDKAKELYIKYKGQNIDEKMSWEEMVKSDFQTFKSKGINSDNFEIITALLK